MSTKQKPSENIKWNKSEDKINIKNKKQTKASLRIIKKIDVRSCIYDRLSKSNKSNS